MKNLHKFMHQLLSAVFYLGLSFFVLSVCWNTGWNLVGDPYALGPYVPWLALVFPIAGLGLWSAFFAQWTGGELRAIHISRWFYLLLFVTLLMVNVLFSVNPVSSLGYLSLWLTGILMISLHLKQTFNHFYFWAWYALALILNLILYYLWPAFINPEILTFAAYFAGLHVWQKKESWQIRFTLSALTLLLSYVLAVSAGLQFLLWLTWGVLWAIEYKNYRRKQIFYWYGALFFLGVWFGALWLPNWTFNAAWIFPEVLLNNVFSVWHGVGWGQLEWAQHLEKTQFETPQNVVTNLWLGTRWWYETGMLLLLWLPSLWLLTLGHGQALKLRSTLFWAIIVFAPSLWLSPAGILLGCFWFFNRESWQS